MTCFDRFDLGAGDAAWTMRKMAFAMIRLLPPLRVAAYLLVAGTIVAGVKASDIGDGQQARPS